LTSILSAFIFSALIVHSVGMPIEVAFIFSFPMFLIIGGFISFFADVYLNTIDFNHIFYKYISGLFIYFISGFFIISFFFFFFAYLYLNTIDFNHIFYKYISGLFIYFISGFFIISLFFAFFGGNMNILIVAIPALLFYHISLLFKAILKKEVTLIKD